MKPVDLLALISNSERMPAWSQQTEDLNVNYLVLDPGSGVAEHLNPAVDVLIVVIAGRAVPV